MTDPDDCYVEYMDRTSNWRLPKDWHTEVSKVDGNSQCDKKVVTTWLS